MQGTAQREQLRPNQNVCTWTDSKLFCLLFDAHCSCSLSLYLSVHYPNSILHTRFYEFVLLPLSSRRQEKKVCLTSLFTLQIIAWQLSWFAFTSPLHILNFTGEHFLVGVITFHIWLKKEWWWKNPAWHRDLLAMATPMPDNNKHNNLP